MKPDRANLVFPRWWRGVKKNHVSVQGNFKIAGFDTETCFGKVFATGYTSDGVNFQMNHGLKKNDPLAHLDWLLEKILSERWKKTKGRAPTVVVASHHLLFDLGVLFFDALNPLGTKTRRAPRRSQFSLLKHQCEVTIIWGRPCFGFIRKDKRTIHLIDTLAFFGTSLEEALKMIGGDVQKLKQPAMLGKRVIPKGEVTPYLRSDTLGVYRLLAHVVSLHEEYQTRLCVSLPMLSGKIFRHYYMKKDFARPNKRLMAAAMLSYHGGKNTFPGEAGWHQNCYDLDVRSAYPEAMKQLPDFEHGKWITGSGRTFVRRHPHGIYRVQGTLKPCTWGCLFDHGFKPIFGSIEERHRGGVWVTGYELLEALRSKEIKVTRVSGFGFQEKPKIKKPANAGGTAFARFVDHFFAAKEAATSIVERVFNKLILNALYGKFIQRNYFDEGDRLSDGTEADQETWEAGSMFDPSVASLITGYVRAKMHRLEHKYDAIHTATDGFITKKKPDPRDLGKEIGTLKQETFGPCLIIRNKLYLHYGHDGALKKYGLHGYEPPISIRKFPDKIATHLKSLWAATGKQRTYSIERLVGWAEAWHLGLPPGKPLFREKILRVKENVGG